MLHSPSTESVKTRRIPGDRPPVPLGNWNINVCSPSPIRPPPTTIAMMMTRDSGVPLAKSARSCSSCLLLLVRLRLKLATFPVCVAVILRAAVCEAAPTFRAVDVLWQWRSCCVVVVHPSTHRDAFCCYCATGGGSGSKCATGCCCAHYHYDRDPSSSNTVVAR